MSTVSAGIVIVDDHPLVREGLKQLLSGLPEFQLLAEASDVLGAQQALDRHVPDVAVIDLTLGQESGVDLVKWTKAKYPQTRVVVLSMQDEALYAERLLRLGINAYVMKSAAETDFITALRKAVRGQRHVSTEMSERLLNKAMRGHAASDNEDPVAALTVRELEVFRLIGGGFSTRQIADQLEMSMKTVDAHRRHMREKLNLRTANELIRYATQWVSGHPVEEMATGVALAE